MPESINEVLEQWLRSGGQRLVQVVITPLTTGGWEMRHETDANASAESLTLHTTAEAARELAKYDSSGTYRPLKGAPSLITGWRLVLPSSSELRQALDFLYPGAVGNWAAFKARKATPVSVRETLSRQTGMYRITGLLTNEDASQVVCQTCDFQTKCRRTIVFGVDGEQPIIGLPQEKTTLPDQSQEMPYLCLEACNWLVAQGRTFIKAKRDSQAKAS